MSYQSEKTGAKVDELLDKIDALEAATTTTAGLMSAADKTALDSIGQKFNDGIAKTDLASGVQDSLDLADTALQSFTETDPTVPAWAKAQSKPTYTASEVGALPDDTVIPDAQIQSDWSQSDNSKKDYIKNKPTIPTVPTNLSSFTDDLGSSPTHTHSQYLTTHQDISGKADKATTLSGYGITDAKIASGAITLGSNTITPITSHQDISGKADKATTLAGYGITDAKIVSGTITLGSSTITPLTSAHEIPSGGNAGQVLSKNSATDYDVHWVNQTTTYPSAYCTTAAGTAAKKAQCTLWTATANTYLHILIGTANTSASALTMNVNSTGAKPIYINGSASSSSNYTLPAGSYIAFYDGTNFHINTDGTIPRVLHKSSTVGLVKNDGTIDTNTYLTSYTETDPTVPSWAKASSKPSYTAAEVGAVPTTRTVNGKALSSDITLSASDVSALPSSTVIPSAPGTLNTDNSTAQTVSSSEALSGTVKLHKVSKTGSYNDLLNTPTIPTVPTNVSAFNNDAGYITASSLNGVTLLNEAIEDIIDIDDEAADIGYFGNDTQAVIEIQNSAVIIGASDDNSGHTASLGVSSDYTAITCNGTSFQVEDGSVTIDSEEVATQTWVNAQGYLTSHQDISGKEDKVAVASISGTTLSAAVGTYYVGSSVGTLAVTLPTITDATKVYSVVLNIATGSSPAVTFTAASGVTISYAKDFAIEASKEYEVNCLWNGTKWLVTAVEFS